MEIQIKIKISKFLKKLLIHYMKNKLEILKTKIMKSLI